MRPFVTLGALTVCCLATLAATSAAAGGKKTHVGVPPRQILNLESDSLPNDNSGGHTLNYDSSGEVFVVPQGFSFVATDVAIQVGTANPAPTDAYGVVMNFDNGGSRTYIARFFGEGFYQHFATGYVMPPGTTPTARNGPESANTVTVQIQGYLVKAAGLAANEPF
jgi:hypothetical protein